MFLSGLKYLRRLERQVKFAKNRCCKIKPVAVLTEENIPGRKCIILFKYIILFKFYISSMNKIYF